MGMCSTKQYEASLRQK